MPVTIVNKPTCLKPEQVAVSAENELVVIAIGNSQLKMHYEDALKLSQWIRSRAKQAKRSCGDVSRHWSTLAILDGIKT